MAIKIRWDRLHIGAVWLLIATVIGTYFMAGWELTLGQAVPLSLFLVVQVQKLMAKWGLIE
jgi:hypothetical protein